MNKRNLKDDCGYGGEDLNRLCICSDISSPKWSLLAEALIIDEPHGILNFSLAVSFLCSLSRPSPRCPHPLYALHVSVSLLASLFLVTPLHG